MDLPHGVCLGLSIPRRGSELAPGVLERLRPAEADFAAGLHRNRQPLWIGGRLAMRTAFDRLGRSVCADILPDERGAPTLPAGLVGSISHKESIAVAMVADDEGWTLGVDIEVRRPLRRDISRRVLRPEELAELDGLGGSARNSAVILRFSLKEAIYKAIDPFLRRYVGFKEVRVSPRGDGSAGVETHLSSGEALAVEARWVERDGFVITSARARSADRATSSTAEV